MEKIGKGTLEVENDKLSLPRMYLVGPEWMIEIWKEMYGNSVDYYIIKNIPR